MRGYINVYTTDDRFLAKPVVDVLPGPGDIIEISKRRYLVKHRYFVIASADMRIYVEEIQ